MTTRQKLVAKKLVENGGSVSKAMVEAGYSPATAKTPQKLTESKGWLELMADKLPDDLLLKKTLEGLEANKQLAARVVFKKAAPTSQNAGELPLAGSQTDDFIEVPDMPTRHKYLETALKMRNKLKEPDDNTQPTNVLVVVNTTR